MSHQTLFEKVWARHLVSQETEVLPAVLYIDLHLLHEVTSPQAFQMLRERRLKPRRPDRCVATMDHSTPTYAPGPDGKIPFSDDQAEQQVQQLRTNCEEFGIELHQLGDPSQGIVHVIGPELGLTQPGMTIVCGDSHTSTHGAFGALAFGIGTSEVGHVLATQCLLQRKPKTCAINVSGTLRPGVSAKDLILAVIAKTGIHGGTGHVFEYRGSAIEALSMEERMTVCNMSIEAGARAGLIAPDHRTFQYLAGRPRAPKGVHWERAIADWATLFSDPDARYDREIHLDGGAVEPMITWGTNPGMAVAVDAPIPTANGDANLRKALDYMRFPEGKPLVGQAIHQVFIGSCTNARISDLRAAADVLAGRKVAPGVQLLVVPGSFQVRKQAEAEGLDRIFLQAGARWGEPGCSMCIAMNGDQLAPGQLAVSTSNRNFEGRQGPGSRTILASPQTAAACAVTGKITDARTLAGGAP